MNKPLSSPRRLSLSLSVLAAAALASPAALAQAPPGGARTTESQVVSRAIANSPDLRASTLELESAAWAVTGEEAQYPFVLELDAGITRTAVPGLNRTELPGPNSKPLLSSPDTPLPGPVIDGTRTSEGYSADAGAQISKRLIWGTDLSFRVEGGWNFDASQHLQPGDTAGYLGPGYGLAAQFTVVQPLMRGSGREVGEAELLAARVRRTSAEIARDRAASDLLRGVVTAYWELWYADAALGIQAQSRSVAVSQCDQAAARATMGALAPADVLTFETRVATRDEDVLNAELDRESKRLELEKQVGAVEGGGAPVGWPSEGAPPTPDPPPADAERAALAESSQLRELEASVELARVQARTAGDALTPRLDLDAYVKAQGLGNDDVGAAFSQLGRLGAVSAHVGITYEAPLDSSQRRAEAARARLAVGVATERLASARQAVLTDLRVAVGRDAAERRKVELAEQTARIAERQLQAEQARFQIGQSTPLAVLEAEDAVRSAHLRVARTRADLYQTSLSIQHITGRLLARYASAARSKTGPAGPSGRRPALVGPRIGLL